MLRPEFASLAAPAPTQPVRLAPPVLPGAGRGFSALMRDVSGEVTEFIEHGSPDLGLSASGQAWRMRARAAVQPPADAAPMRPTSRPSTVIHWTPVANCRR